LVTAVYDIAGLDGIAVVWCESRFNPKAQRREPGGTSWGLWQLYDRYHDQHRDYLWAHIESGAAFLATCKERAGGDYVKAVSLYNSGSMTKSRKWGERVKRERDRLEWWLLIKLR
jgi:soluble lytic murein transglycosylase-like protein